MTVKQLISKLKKMPQNLEVGVAAHDNSEFEVSGWICSVLHEEKRDYDPAGDPSSDRDMIEDQPDEWVVLRC